MRTPYLLLLVVTACQPSSDRFAAMDLPAPAPRAAADGGHAPDASAAGMSEAKAAECGRGTGRNPEGQCVALTTRDAGYVQRVMIPGGAFVMGSTPRAYDAATGRDRPAVRMSGQPPRQVEVGAFWIDLHEVTREAYGACTTERRCTPAECDGEDPTQGFSEEIAIHLPQTCVTHEQAEIFCRTHGARLATEAEWEYSARGTDARIYPWGNELVDELPVGLVPVGRSRQDTSYFGILGMGTNASEWVADPFEPDAGLRPFLSGTFRSDAGPLATSRRAFERKLACGEGGARGCSASGESSQRHVIKMTRSGDRRAGRDVDPEHPVALELEGWPLGARQLRVGFRCAADLAEGDIGLTAPEPPPPIPLIRTAGVVEVFGGVAEAVSQREARKFCSVLRVPEKSTGRVLEDWRLPTRHEVRSIVDNFRGPGPFWAEDGATVQQGAAATPLPQDPWIDLPAERGEALAARCVRDPG